MSLLCEQLVCCPLSHSLLSAAHREHCGCLWTPVWNLSPSHSKPAIFQKTCRVTSGTQILGLWTIYRL